MGLLRFLVRGLFGKGAASAQSGAHRRRQVELAAGIRPFTQTARPPVAPPTPKPGGVTLRGRCWVIDGDTIVIDKVHIRLSGIDAPELDHPWGQKAKFALVALCRGQIVTAVTDGSVSHERAVAMCHLPDGRDLGAEMVRAGFALDWPRYSGGRYRHLEAPDARKRLWRADARQKGRMPQGGRDQDASPST